jgi:citrate lyase subunit beta/citryl-CoA lyase
MLEKARGLSCDAVVLDLEDAVAPEAKEQARAAVCAALRSFGSREVVVRINSLASPWGSADLDALRKAAPDAVVIPKIAVAADVMRINIGLPLWAMIETPMSVLHLAAIAATGVKTLILGTNDLLKEMHARALPDRRNLWATMNQIVMAARAHGLAAIDGTFNDIADHEGFVESCAQGKMFGFDGKTLIHPSQLDACNRLFAPSPAEIEQARNIIAAFAAQPDKGAIALNGHMIERLHAEEAARILALAAFIAGSS